MLVGFAAVFALIAWRLVSIQGFGSAGLEKVSAAAGRTIVLPGLRGSILADNGDELALSEMRPTIFADPGEIPRGRAPAEAAALAPVLHRPVAALTAELTRHTTYVVLAAAVSQTTGTSIGHLALAGIGTENVPVRYYPDGQMASPILGFIDAAGRGVGGLEENDNSVLAGRPGKLVEEVDPAGYYVPGTRTVDQPAVNGQDLLTTIDQSLQYQTESSLAKAITTAKAKGGTAIIMDTKTGALLAVASMVTTPKGAVVQAPSSSAFTLSYEPGSVAKVVTLSAALATRAITPRQTFTVPYNLRVADQVIHDAEFHPTEQLDPTGILAQSSNIGAIEVAQKLGPDKLYHYLQAYGLTSKTAINFPGESPGIVPTPAHFSGTSLATIAFGQGIAVTAAQMTAAINTVANGGVYVPPKLVTATVDGHGREHLLAAGRSHRVVPTSIAGIMTSKLEQVVAAGTGTAAAIPGYAVAGKTGTANQVGKDGKYIPSVYISSFAGFAPAKAPRVTAMVVIDSTGQYGAAAAAPAFSQIVRDALLDLDIPSTGAQPAPTADAYPKVNGRVQRPAG